MNGDKEQEDFTNGLAEEILNALIQIPGLQAIARTSAFNLLNYRTQQLKLLQIKGDM